MRNQTQYPLFFSLAFFWTLTVIYYLINFDRPILRRGITQNIHHLCSEGKKPFEVDLPLRAG
jgi:hypothetical protein